MNKRNPNISSEVYLNSSLKERIQSDRWDETLLDEHYSAKIYKIKIYR